MSLILAIEADRRQATLLASIGRRVGAELVIAPTAERGLDAIGGRVPDLVLTSALLSLRDDAAISDHLRELDGAAAHVQMLTIPVLAKPSRRRAQPSGILGKLRGGGDGDSQAGCDPSLFAEQVTEYLDRAETERRAREAELALKAEAVEHAPAADAPLEPVVARETAATVQGEYHEPPLFPPEPVVERVVFEAPASIVVKSAEAVEIVAAGGQGVVPTIALMAPSTAIVTVDHDTDPAEAAPVAATLEAAPIELGAPAEVETATAADVECLPVAEPDARELDPTMIAHEPLPLAAPESPAVDSALPPPEAEAESAPHLDDPEEVEIDLTEVLEEGPDILEIDSAAVDIAAMLGELESAAFDAGLAAAAIAPGADDSAGIDEGTKEPALESAPPEASPTSTPSSMLEAWAELPSGRAVWPTIEGEAVVPEQAGAATPAIELAPAEPVAAQAAVAVPAATTVPVAVQPQSDEPVAATCDAAPLALATEVAPPAAAAPPAAPPVAAAPIATVPVAAPPVETAPVSATALASAPATATPAATKDEEPRRPKKPRKPKPVQDEWGLFDPDQCGFAALLEKLNELASDDAA